MTDAELIAALRVLGPASELPGLAIFSRAAIEAAGLDPARVEALAAAAGGGPIEAGALKLRKGQRPRDARPGRPEPFIALPRGLLERLALAQHERERTGVAELDAR